MSALRVVAAACALALVALLAPSGAAAKQPTPAEAVALLRGGGFILYFRHAATDFGQNDAQMTSFEDCSTQRNLTDRGRDDARALGAAIRALAIPIGQVRASPYCRTVETATLAFGRAEKTQAVRGGPAQPDTPDRYAALRKLLAQPPSRGVNDVIVSHGNPFVALAGPPYLAEGEAAVVAPEKDGFRVVARIKVDEWAAAQ
ncbi:MAG TPA: histidine phosphatase family protein [Burkholderiales bacterium]|nr:histidine phosphatase family protein [Burkholderiales bacterium]